MMHLQMNKSRQCASTLFKKLYLFFSLAIFMSSSECLKEGVTNEYLLCGLKIFVTQLVPLYTFYRMCVVNLDVSAVRITRLLQQQHTKYMNFRFDTDRPFFRNICTTFVFVCFFFSICFRLLILLLCVKLSLWI